jgi:hypothetical protein
LVYRSRVRRPGPSTSTHSFFKVTKPCCALPRPGSCYSSVNHRLNLRRGGSFRLFFGCRGTKRLLLLLLLCVAATTRLLGAHALFRLVIGILSSFRGVATVYAVKAAGLAIGIGIGSSCIVLVSFGWGIFVFHEHVHSIAGACWAIFALMVGIVGMSYYSSPPVQKGQEEVYDSLALAESTDDGHPHLPTSDPEDENRLQSDSAIIIDGGSAMVTSTTKDNIVRSFVDDDAATHSRLDNTRCTYERDGIMRHDETSAGTAVVVDHDHTCLFGRKVKKRHLGMLAAAFCGIWGGSILAVRPFCVTSITLEANECLIANSSFFVSYPIIAHEMVQIKY